MFTGGGGDVILPECCTGWNGAEQKDIETGSFAVTENFSF